MEPDMNGIGVIEDPVEKLNENKVNELIPLGLRIGLSVALHPFEYARVLIQLGFEPIPPCLGKSFFGRPIMILPNIFQYANYIRRVDGFCGIYRGLVPKLISSIVWTVCNKKLPAHLGLTDIAIRCDNISDFSDDELYVQFTVNLKRDILSITGIIVAQPFHLISLRMMAQFIGRETSYQSIFGSFMEIYRTEGILGFFSGIVPKILFNVAFRLLSTTTVHLLNKYVNKPHKLKQRSTLAQFFFVKILCPLEVVATCMAVSGSNLVAGRPPVMPEYRSWIDCWKDLQKRGELKRGSRWFWRTIGDYAKTEPNCLIIK